MKILKEFTIAFVIEIIIVAFAPIVTSIICNNVYVLGIISTIALLLLVVLMLYSMSKPLNPSSYENIEKKLKTRYSIAIIDDEFGNRKTNIIDSFRKHFVGWDILFLKSVNDARMLEAYDIVIMDIFNANEMQGDTCGIFDDIYRLYPEKYVIAMSQNGCDCGEICRNKRANASLPKPMNSGKIDTDRLKSDIKKSIDQAFNELDNPMQYWESIKARYTEKEEINFARKRYASFILSHSNFKKKNWFSW